MNTKASSPQPGADTRIWSEDADFGPTRWYWRDADCDEDIGPFDSHAEALADYRDLRSVSSSDAGSNR